MPVPRVSGYRVMSARAGNLATSGGACLVFIDLRTEGIFENDKEVTADYAHVGEFVVFYARRKGSDRVIHTEKMDRRTWKAYSFITREDYMARFVNRAVTVGAGDGDDFDPTFESTYPAVHEYVSLASVDGKPRKTSTMTIMVQNGLWTVFLNDRVAGASLCVTSPTWPDLMARLEEVLNSDCPPWRLQQADGSMTRKKR